MELPALLQNRAVSGFPVSIGTGLALESIIQPVQESVNETPLDATTVDNNRRKYDLFIFNVNTLFRNILNTFKFQEISGIRPTLLAQLLIEEITFISEFFEAHGMTTGFYVNNYDYFIRTYKENLRKSTTERQLRIDYITDQAIKEAIKHFPNIRQFTKEVKYTATNALILTHVPADLLSHPGYTSLDLLESHTGLIKSRRLWNTKYFKVPDKDMSFLPFTEYLLTIFGDSVMFKPQALAKRLEVYEHMVKKGVNPLTSELSLSFIRGKS